MESIDRQLAAFDLKRRIVKGGGNCAYRSYAVLLGREEDSYQQIRDEIADVMERNRVEFEELQLVPGNIRIRVQNKGSHPNNQVYFFIVALMVLAGWGDSDTHVAFAMLAQRDLVVFMLDATGRLCYHRFSHNPQNPEASAAQAPFAVVFEYHPGQSWRDHYNVVVRRDSVISV